MKTTVREFAAMHNVSNLTANSVLQFLVSKGVASLGTPLKIEGKKGKPQNTFEIPSTVSWENVAPSANENVNSEVQAETTA